MYEEIVKYSMYNIPGQIYQLIFCQFNTAICLLYICIYTANSSNTLLICSMEINDSYHYIRVASTSGIVYLIGK